MSNADALHGPANRSYPPSPEGTVVSSALRRVWPTTGDTLLKHFLQSLSRMYATAPKNGMDNISFSLLETLVRNDHSIMHERCSKAVDRTALSLFVPQCQLFGIGGSL